MTRPLALVLVLATLAAGAAHARPFQQADRDSDGFVDFEEAGRIYPSLTQAQFRRFDMDRDGFLSRREYPMLLNVYDVLVRPK
jgi:Ca2+-binding EF-hand superfamily protein